MTDLLLGFVPVFAGVLAGHLLVRLGVATRDQGRFLFVLAFYVCVPALIFEAFADAELTRGLLVMPVAAAAAVSGGYVAALSVSRALRLSPVRAAVFLLAGMIVNTGFLLPFVDAALGTEGVTRLLAFDVVNATLVLTWAYTVAARANPGHEGGGLPWRRLAGSAPLYGLAAGIAVNASGAEVPAVVSGVTTAFAAPTLFLLTVAIGMVLDFAPTDVRVGALGIATRIAVSLVVVTVIVVAFDVDGAARAVLAAVAVAPIGFNTVTFATLEDLDVGLAVSASSMSLAGSLVLVPVALLLTA